MNIHEAQPIAERVLRLLAPHCDRIEIAGSIRREKPEVGDIEIVAIPKAVAQVDLFGGYGAVLRSVEFVRAVRGLGMIEKGDPLTGRYVQVSLPECISLDLFLAHADNWGYILAIRTGSAEFSHVKLAAGWKRAGFEGRDGMLTRAGQTVPVREERELFDLIGLPWVDPKWRIF